MTVLEISCWGCGAPSGRPCAIKDTGTSITWSVCDRRIEDTIRMNTETWRLDD